jgi:hypothetical protein
VREKSNILAFGLFTLLCFCFRYLLKKALDAVVAQADSAREELQQKISEMMNRLFSVLKSVVLLSTFDNEPENKVCSSSCFLDLFVAKAQCARWIFVFASARATPVLPIFASRGSKSWPSCTWSVGFVCFVCFSKLCL